MRQVNYFNNQKNGKLSSIEFNTDDKEMGTQEFYKNGNTKYEEIFKNDQPIDKQYYYNLKGKVTKIETWKKGKLISTE